jgi:glycosyltransferase involved in cell wall biosynthesis
MVLLYLVFVFIALYARYFAKRQFDVGLGPQPLINNIYHKKALQLYGYSARTFVLNTFFITEEFDYKFGILQQHDAVKALLCFTHTVMNYKMLYTYMNGTMLYMRLLPKFLQRLAFALEPRLYKLAGMKVLVMPYGGDVHDLAKCPNMLMKNSIIKDYPLFQKQWRDTIGVCVDSWIKHADHVISGCDWVWFMHHWDTLMSGHFSIDTHNIKPKEQKKLEKGDLIKIFHGPNHKTIKGSKHFERVVESLRNKGYNVELVLVQKKPNDELLEIMMDCHIVADQLIIGWYAMTALEGMALGKPILCYLHPELLNLYVEQEVIQEVDIPIVQCSYRDVEERIQHLLDNPELINEIGNKSRKFVEKYHSLEYIGGVFDGINRANGISPSHAKQLLGDAKTLK